MVARTGTDYPWLCFGGPLKNLTLMRFAMGFLVRDHSENENDSIDTRTEAATKHVHRNGLPLLEEKRERKKNFDVVREKTEERYLRLRTNK